MNYCRISLKPVKSKSKYPHYLDSEFRKLFKSLKVNPALSFARKDFFRQSTSKSKGLSISGVQQKLSLKINSNKELEMTSTEGEYILKPSPEAFPHASENEHCAMLTSRMLGIETALCALISFSDGELVYITKRFDRKGDGKIHQEDLVQGFGMKSEDKYAYSYEKAGKLINLMANGKASVVFDFFCRVVHAYIIGNDDLHLKNISLQKLPENTRLYYDRLAPNYDSLFTNAFDNVSGSGFLALDLLENEGNGLFSKAYEKYGFYTGYDFKALGNRLGLREKPVTTFINTVKKKESMLIDLINCSSMPDDMKKKASLMISERIKTLGLG
ncbi:MAG: HipA domain-containing protein [Desulfobacula sp.]|nr:HipA domain-containing protein [Desulfobacula sp.]